MSAVSKLTIEEMGGVECSGCKNESDETVSLSFCQDINADETDETVFILCQTCLSNAITGAVEDGSVTNFKS